MDLGIVLPRTFQRADKICLPRNQLIFYLQVSVFLDKVTPLQ